MVAVYQCADYSSHLVCGIARISFGLVIYVRTRRSWHASKFVLPEIDSYLLALYPGQLKQILLQGLLRRFTWVPRASRLK